MIGNGYPAESFRRTARRPEVAGYVRDEYREIEPAWLMRDARASTNSRPAFAQLRKTWFDIRTAAAKFAALFF